MNMELDNFISQCVNQTYLNQCYLHGVFNFLVVKHFFKWFIYIEFVFDCKYLRMSVIATYQSIFIGR